MTSKVDEVEGPWTVSEQQYSEICPCVALWEHSMLCTVRSQGQLSLAKKKKKKDYEEIQ